MLYEVITDLLSASPISNYDSYIEEIKEYAKLSRITSYNVCYTKLLRGSDNQRFHVANSLLWSIPKGSKDASEYESIIAVWTIDRIDSNQ